MNTQIQSIVDSFVRQLSDAWKQSVIEALNGLGRVGSGALGVTGKAAKSPASSGPRPKGEKRERSEIDALKEKFVAFVSANPGLRIEQINKALGTSTKNLALPIRQLIADKQIRAKGSKRATSYVAAK